MLNRGDAVYRVVEVVERTPFSKHVDTSWHVQSQKVQTSTDKVVILEGRFPGIDKRHFPAKALGTVFHATEQEAVRAFADQAQRGIESAKRAIELCAEQKDWAAQWTSATGQDLGRKAS